MDDLLKFRDLFFETAFSHVEEAKNLIDKLKLDSANKSIIGDLHIHIHSLKGEAYAMNYALFGEFLTLIEKHVKSFTQDDFKLSAAEIELINNSILETEGILNYLKNETKEPEELNQKIENIRKQIGNGI